MPEILEPLLMVSESPGLMSHLLIQLRNLKVDQLWIDSLIGSLSSSKSEPTQHDLTADHAAVTVSSQHIAKVGFGTKPASWILVWLRAHGSFPGFVLETPRRGRLKRNARSRGLCILYNVISWPGFVLSPTFWRKQSTMSGFVHLINGKRGVYI